MGDQPSEVQVLYHRVQFAAMTEASTHI